MSNIERLMLVVLVGLACPFCLPIVATDFDEKKENKNAQIS